MGGRSEARTANSMLATMFLLASVVSEPAVAFSIFKSHLIPLFTVVSGIRQMGAKSHHVSRANWQTRRPVVNRPLIGVTFQLRSLRVVTQSATLESFPVVRAVVWRNQHTSKLLRAAGSGCMSSPS
jgi:hypothetical protein